MERSKRRVRRVHEGKRRRGLSSAALGLVVLAAACGNSTEKATSTIAPAPATTSAPTTSAAPTTTVAPTSTAAPTTTTTLAPTTTAAPAPSTTSAPVLKIKPTDPVVLNCTDNPVLQVMTVYRERVGGSIQFIPQYTINTKNLAAAAGLNAGVLGQCEARKRFTADFSKYADSASTKSGVSHAGYYDLAERRFVDVTAPRVGTGFSDSNIAEVSIAFISEPDRLAMTDRLLIRRTDGPDSGQFFIVDLADPTVATPAPDFDDRMLDSAGSGTSLSPNYGRTIPNPSGTLVTDGGIIWPFGRRDEYLNLPSECQGSQSFSGDQFLGWRDDTHLLVGRGENVLMLEVAADGTPGACVPLLPPENNRPIRDVMLSPFRDEVFFTSRGQQANEAFSIPVDGSTTEPRSAIMPKIQQGWRLFFGAAA